MDEVEDHNVFKDCFYEALVKLTQNNEMSIIKDLNVNIFLKTLSYSNPKVESLLTLS